MKTEARRLLIVDDDSIDRQSILRLLGNQYTVFQSKTGNDAIKTHRTCRPDCALIDYRLPDMNGLELVRRFHEAGTAVVMLTGEGDEAVAVEAMKAGAYDYVPKERLDAPRLDQSIRKAWERSRLELQLAETRRELEGFVRLVAHDLKSPLATIVGYLAMAMDTAGNALPEAERGLVRRSEQLATGLIELIDQLAKYTNLGRSESEFDSVDLNEVAREAVERLQAVAQEAEAFVEVGDLPTAVGSKTDLVQLLQNLIANALKFQSDATPRVEISAESIGGEQVISVADNGIGIAEESRDAVFAPLYRLHSEEAFAGQGLGLATCWKIVAQHNGRIWVDPGPEGGSVFRFSLPLQPE